MMASIEATTKMLVMTRHHGAAVNAIYVINKCLTFWIQSNQTEVTQQPGQPAISETSS